MYQFVPHLSRVKSLRYHTKLFIRFYHLGPISSLTSNIKIKRCPSQSTSVNFLSNYYTQRWHGLSHRAFHQFYKTIWKKSEKTNASMRNSLRLQKLLTRSGETVVRMTRATVAVNNYRGFYRQIIHIVGVSI